MAEFLLIDPKTIAKTTILRGNVDIDKYRYCIFDAQIIVLEPLLGTDLYNKVLQGAENNTLTGIDAELYDRFVKPIVKNEALARYLEVASYTVANGGIFKHAPEKSEIVDKEEVQYLANKYHAIGQMYILRYEKWSKENNISDCVDGKINIKTTYGWYL